MQPRVAVILGPTATGKSNCGIMLAQALQGEIISGDSMLVYKNMDIATAKPTAREQLLVPHHLIDILQPEEEFNVADFQKYADNLINEINARGHLPIIVGGTGLYIKALLEGYDFSHVEISKELRTELEHFADVNGAEALHHRLCELDADAAERLHVNDRRRIIRAIETALEGEKVSQKTAEKMPYDAVVFGLRMSRPVLYERINHRVDVMMAAGIIEETMDLLSSGVPSGAQSMRSIGYRQIVEYFSGIIDKETCVEKIKQATRNFAKRQFTWYKKMPYIHWIDVAAEPDYESYVAQMREILVKKYNLR